MSISDCDAEVRIEHVSHRYNSQWAVKDVSFTLTGRRITGLLGANGAGKSTLMNITCGALTPTCGEVFINGYSIRRDPVAAKRQIGFLPQKPPLLADLTVEEYLGYAAELRRVGTVRKAVEEAMERCGISHFRKRLVKHLSGGYQQRVGIAQAIIHHPAFIVLDEPTNGLDPTQIVEIRRLIGEISGECLVMLSTHILHEVQLACERILMMADGEMIFEGGIDDFNHSVSPRAIVVSVADAPQPDRWLDIPGIAAVEPLPEQAGTFRLLFRGESDRVCEQVVRHAVGHDWRLREIRKELPSADDIFKYLTSQPHRNTD